MEYSICEQTFSQTSMYLHLCFTNFYWATLCCCHFHESRRLCVIQLLTKGFKRRYRWSLIKRLRITSNRVATTHDSVSSAPLTQLALVTLRGVKLEKIQSVIVLAKPATLNYRTALNLRPILNAKRAKPTFSMSFRTKKDCFCQY